MSRRNPAVQRTIQSGWIVEIPVRVARPQFEELEAAARAHGFSSTENLCGKILEIALDYGTAVPVMPHHLAHQNETPPDGIQVVQPRCKWDHECDWFCPRPHSRQLPAAPNLVAFAQE